MSGEISDIERDLEYLWSNYQATPKIMGMSLGNLRKADWAKDEDIQKFLKENESFSDECTVVLTPWDIRIYKEDQFQVFLDILKGGVT